MIRAAACNYWAQGIDGLSLINWTGNYPYDASFYEQLREIPHPAVMAPKDKFYFIPTVGGRGREAVPTEHGLTMQLPADLQVGSPARLDLPVSDDLPRWDRVGRVHEVILRVRIMRYTEQDRLSFKLNGKELPSSILRKINHNYMNSAPRYRSHSSYWFIFKLDRDHWPREGNNTVEVTLHHRAPDVTPEIYVRDVELEIKYLRGKSLHRGQHSTDPDLGPYEA
jgi:hypothetical protein